MGYTKTSDHLHSPPITPKHFDPPKIFFQPPPPTNKKCPPNHTHPIYTLTHLHPPIKRTHATAFIQNFPF